MTGKFYLLSLPLLFLVLNPIAKQNETLTTPGAHLFHNAHRVIDTHRINDGGTKSSLHQGSRIISFAGYNWIVSQSGNGRGTPGPNYFSNSKENVWVDALGRLHLKISYTKGRWECAEVILMGAVSHGEYTFRVSSNINGFDKNIVVGLFLYRDDQNEADIEFSRWGDEENRSGQFTVQPSDREGNLLRFAADKAGRRSTHRINWNSDFINFISYRGHSSLPRERFVLSEWKYQGDDIPTETRVKVMINLWLFRGIPPSDKKEAELIIKDVSIRRNK